MNIFLILIGKLLSFVSQKLNLGHGSTWPGHIALSLNKNFVRNILRKSDVKIVLIAGTNGKTTTGKLIKTILKHSGSKVFQNESGANLLNGLTSSLLLHTSFDGKLRYDYGVFEVDENSLPLVLKELAPDYIILLNLFRDQLDRYGEVNTIAERWKDAVKHLSKKTTVILNADDPQITYLGKNVKAKTYYFGLDDKKLHQTSLQHAVDSTYCPKCGNKLTYQTIYFSHLGDWQCKKCGNKRPLLDTSLSPVYPLVGVYNRYNTHTAVLFAKLNNVPEQTVKQSLSEFKPAFGRQETLEVNGKRVQIFLSKNPTSFNQSLQTVKKLGGKNILFVLNDRIPDGRDVSWIWDVDFEELVGEKTNIVISGDRCYDLGLRIKYTSSSQVQNAKFKMQSYNSKFKIVENLRTAVGKGLKNLGMNETLYILPTYSAMLEVRKILTGRKIL